VTVTASTWATSLEDAPHWLLVGRLLLLLLRMLLLLDTQLALILGLRNAHPTPLRLGFLRAMR
jgi:hypothetical protein